MADYRVEISHRALCVRYESERTPVRMLDIHHHIPTIKGQKNPRALQNVTRTDRKVKRIVVTYYTAINHSTCDDILTVCLSKAFN